MITLKLILADPKTSKVKYSRKILPIKQITCHSAKADSVLGKAKNSLVKLNPPNPRLRRLSSRGGIRGVVL